MKMKPLTASLLLILCAIALALTGCSGENKQAQSPLDPKKPVTITVWHYYNGAQLTAFDALMEEFNTTVGKERGIVVEGYGQGSVNDLETNVLNSAQGRVGSDPIPNIFAAYADTAYTINQMGLAVDLNRYLTEEDLAALIDSYVEEGRFDSAGGLKIYPIAKSVELLLLNKTDWEPFAAATGATYDDFATIEGIAATAKAYYEWTDSLTLEPNDGKAFFGRDAMANYMLIGARQMGVEIFSVEDGKMTLNFDRDTMRALWDNYYVPYVQGYFSSSGRFRSDDVKTGNIICFVGSSSGATFFPNQVIVSDTEKYPIEMEAFVSPRFAGGEAFAVQQGAGMVVTKGTEAEEYASIEFLKWFTEDERNIAFSVDSGYLPVSKTANDMRAIQTGKPDLAQSMRDILTRGIETVNANTMYTPKAFETGTSARAILEYSMSDLALQDRAIVVERLEAGKSLEEAAAAFLTDAYFDQWYRDTLSRLEALTNQ